MSKDSSSSNKAVVAATYAKFSKVPRVPWNPWVGLVFVAIIFYFSQFIGAIFVSIYPHFQHWPHGQAVDWLNNSALAQFIFILIAESTMIGAIYLFLRHYRQSFKIIGLVKPRWRDLGYGLLAVPAYYLFYLLTVAIASHFAPGLKIDQHQDIGFNDVQGPLQLLLAFFSLVILPPIGEEILVRGFLYSTLKKAMPTLVAVLSTSLLFAAAHLPEGGSTGLLYIAALDTFILSLVLIYLREKTGSLWASMTLHATKNGVAFFTLFVLKVH